MLFQWDRGLVAQVVAVGIAGWWTYHLHDSTGEGVVNPNATLQLTVLPYYTSKDQRLLLVHVHPKNAGKVPIYLRKPDDLRVKVKRIPEQGLSGVIDVDRLPKPVAEIDGMLKRYGDEYELDPGVEFDEVASFVLPLGLYHVEAELSFGKEGDTVGDQEIVELK